MRINEKTKEARRRYFVGSWPSLINSSLSLAKTLNTKKRERLSVLSSITRLLLLSAIFEKTECASLVVFKASFIRRVKASR
jgi:hypothetical protein